MLYRDYRDIESDCDACSGEGDGDGPEIGPDVDIGQDPGGNDVPDIKSRRANTQRGGTVFSGITNDTSENKSNLFYTITFKSLLTQLGNSVDYISDQLNYPDVTSVIGQMSHIKDSNFYSLSESCIDCSGSEISRTHRLEILRADQEDLRVTNFRIHREADYYKCQPGNSEIDCVLQEFGEGCYETFKATGSVIIPTDVQFDESFLFKETTFSCTEFVRDQFYNSDNGFQDQSFNLKSTRWHKIDDPWNACPLDSMRPFSALTGQFPSFDSGCDGCLPNPCECWNCFRFGFNYGLPDTGGWTEYIEYAMPVLVDANGNQIGRGNTNCVPLHRCQGMGLSPYSVDVESVSENVSTSCAPVQTCMIGPTTADGNCFGDGCHEPGTFSGDVASFRAGVETEADTIHGFEITRYELLNQLPDPAVWPNV